MRIEHGTSIHDVAFAASLRGSKIAMFTMNHPMSTGIDTITVIIATVRHVSS
jgi:hypothetical protein